MRCYNKKCEKWKGVICGCPCEKRIGAKNTAIAHGCWEETNKAKIIKIGTSLGIIVPAITIKKYNLKEGDYLEIVEEENNTKFIIYNK